MSGPAVAGTNTTASHTLAPPLAVHPPCRIVNGIKIVYEIKPGELHRERKEVFEDTLKADRIHGILKDLSRTGFVYEASLYNAFDAIIDKMEEFGFKGYKGEIVSELYLEGEEVVIKITDNGKTIEFESEGKPKLRERDIVKQFGGRGRGVPLIRSYVWSREGTLKWHQLKNGTRIEIRLPRRHLPGEIRIKKDDRIIIENEEETSFWDGETARSVKAGETFGRSFRNRWAFADIGFLMAQALELQISKHTLISLVKEHIENKDGTGEIILEGYDIDGIEEIRDGDEITAFSLPVTRDNKPAYRLVYSMAETEASATVIPLSDGTNLYVKAGPAVMKLEETALEGPRPIEGIDLWEDPDIAEELAEMENSLAESERRYFRAVDENKVPDIIKKAKDYAGVYELEKEASELQLIRKTINNIDDVKAFLRHKSPWCCPTFFAREDIIFNYELNLEPLGYISLSEATKDGVENITEEMRVSIRKAVSESLRQGDDVFTHGHLHDKNIMVKFDDHGKLMDIKIVDWKYIERTEIPEEVRELFSGKKDNLYRASLMQKHLAGYDLEGIYSLEADFSYSNMAWVNLRKAVLTRAILEGAFLFGADLRYTDLRDSDLSRADLVKAVLNGADLRNATLWSADLRDADLSDADLRDSDLLNTDLKGTILINSDLRGVDFDLPEFKDAVLRNTKFNRDQGHVFKAQGFHVVYKDQWCEVTSPELVSPEPVKPDKETEQIHTRRFSDNFRLIQAKEDKRISFIALGTSWIKGYEKGRHLQYDDLNRLIISIRRFCGEKGIEFIDGDDVTVAARVCGIKKDLPEARGIVLAGEETIERIDSYLKGSGLGHDENILLAGVNNRKLTTDSYMRLMEMLTLTLELYRTRTIDEKAVKDSHPRLGFQLKSKRRITFEPDAESMDYESLKHLYKVQVFA